MKSTTLVSSFAILTASLLVGYQVFAHCGKCAEDGKKIATQLDKNSFTLAKAVTAAEQHSKGRYFAFIGNKKTKQKHASAIAHLIKPYPKRLPA